MSVDDATIASMIAPHDGTVPAPLAPGFVLTTAFAQHDFTITRDGQEIHIQTSEPVFDGDTAYIEVNAIIWADEDSAVTHRYRIEYVASD